MIFKIYCISIHKAPGSNGICCIFTDIIRTLLHVLSDFDYICNNRLMTLGIIFRHVFPKTAVQRKIAKTKITTCTLTDTPECQTRALM